MAAWVVGAVCAAVVVAAIILYNNLVRARNRVDNAWSQVDVQLQRRWDLIPNLVQTVQGYAQHESATLQEVTAARARALGAATPQAKVGADDALTRALKSLFAVAEAYPELRANANFQQLQSQLAETEDKVSYMRQSYNDTVMAYNNAIQTFPGMLLSGLFKPRQSFAADADAAEAPGVIF